MNDLHANFVLPSDIKLNDLVKSLCLSKLDPSFSNYAQIFQDTKVKRQKKFVSPVQELHFLNTVSS